MVGEGSRGGGINGGGFGDVDLALADAEFGSGFTEAGVPWLAYWVYTNTGSDCMRPSVMS